MYVYTQTYVVHVLMYVLHMNMPERLRDSANTGGQNLQILKLLNVMVTGEGGGK